jgi:hypothetical protein
MQRDQRRCSKNSCSVLAAASAVRTCFLSVMRGVSCHPRRSACSIGRAPDHRVGTERGLRARGPRGQGGGLLHQAVCRQRSGSRRRRGVGDGGRSPHRGSDAPQSGAAPSGRHLRPGGPLALRRIRGARTPVASCGSSRRLAAVGPAVGASCASNLAVSLAMLTAAVADLRTAQHHAAQAAAARRAAEHLRGATVNHRPGPGPAEARVRASDVARMDFPDGLTVTRPTPPERQTPRRPPRPRPAARRARPPPS